MNLLIKRLVYIVLLFSPFVVPAQNSGRPVAVRFRDFYNQQNADSLFALFSPMMQQVATLDKTKQLITQLHSQAGEFKSVDPIGGDSSQSLYKSVFTNLTLTMSLVVNKDGQIDGLHFIPYTPPGQKGVAYPPSNFQLQTATGSIFGTLLAPETKQKVPIVLIIAGSGPTDRDCNSTVVNLSTNAYKMLADSLLSYGIASLRFDKRGIAASSAAMKTQSDLRFGDYINDAAGIIKLLKANDRWSKVIVLGHSEGSLIGMIAAREANADAYISLAGAGDRIDKILVRQISAQQSPQLAARASVLLDSLRAGYSVSEPRSDPSLMPLFSSSIQPYMKSWLQYNPQEEIKKLTIPILILQGNTDMQVSTEDAQQLKKAKGDATLEIIAGMNHVLKPSTDDRKENTATYHNPTLPIKTELVQDL